MSCLRLGVCAFSLRVSDRRHGADNFLFRATTFRLKNKKRVDGYITNVPDLVADPGRSGHIPIKDNCKNRYKTIISEN